MDSSILHVGDARSLRACQGRVLMLSQFLERDWDQENPLWLMNSTLQLAEATTRLVLQEVEAAGETPVQITSEPEEILTSLEICKQRVIALVQQLSKETHSHSRISIALKLAHASSTLAQRQGVFAIQTLSAS